MKFRFVVFLLVVYVFAGRVDAGDASEILGNLEENTLGSKAPRDMQALMVMTIVSGSSQRVRELKAWTKNRSDQDDWRIMKFVSPADIKGLGFLVLAEDKMYLYLPEFHRTRRIASSNKKDAFVGSDFSYDDLGTAKFSTHYNPRLATEDDRAWVLELNLKADASKPYRRILLTISKENVMPLRMELFDSSGILWKVAEQTSVRVGNYWVLGSIKMMDKKRDSHTLLELKDIQVDQKLDDEIFSERFLKRGI